MNHLKQAGATPRFPSSGAAWLSLVCGMGLLIRGIALYNIYIINPDGAFYIYQAKAIATGQWQLLNDCQLTYVTLYPLLIALAHTMVSDWILSAQLVSLFFGVAMLIPIYMILRQFCSRQISLLTTLMYAFIPVFVRYSVDAMRDATFWFFLAASIWAFLSHLHKGHRSPRALWLLVLSSCLALLAMLTRIEAAVFYPAACLFILFARGDRKFLRLFAFILPPVLVAGSGIVLAMSQTGIDVEKLTRLDAVMQELTAPYGAYQTLRHHLKTLSSLQDNTIMGEFLSNARHMTWLIALGAIVSNAMEAFFFPFVPFFAIGAVAGCRQVNRRSPLFFVVILLACSFLLLYAHVIQTWIMTYRFISLLIIPSCIFAGLGMEAVANWLALKRKVNRSKAIVVLVLLTLIPAVVKDAKPTEADKAVYTRIADRIVQLEDGRTPVGIAARDSTAQRWINFYANVGSGQPICHLNFKVAPKSMAALESFMRQNGIDYFLWEESMWKNSPFGRNASDFSKDFDKMGAWYHVEPGNLVLFRLKDSGRRTNGGGAHG